MSKLRKTIKTKETCKPCGTFLAASYAPNAVDVSKFALDCPKCGYFKSITRKEFESYKNRI